VKQCSKCGEQKPLNQFHRDKSNKDGLYAYCKTCACAKTAAWKQANPERNKEGQRISRRKRPRVYRNKNLMYSFGISLEQYEQMEAAQGGVCAVCGQPEREIHPRSGKRRNLAVDHDHNTNQIRGLLCNACNRGIGLLNDDPEMLRAAIAYLERQKPPAETGGQC
jgi:hypothetical protein